MEESIDTYQIIDVYFKRIGDTAHFVFNGKLP